MNPVRCIVNEAYDVVSTSSSFRFSSIGSVQPTLSEMAASSLSNTLTRSGCRRPNSLDVTRKSFRPQLLECLWLGGGGGPIYPIKFSLHSSTLRPFSHKPSPAQAIVSLSPSASKPEKEESANKIPKWSSKATKAYAMAALEARKLRCQVTGTEALLLGILVEGTNLASQFLRANGITLFKVQDEVVKLLGEGDFVEEFPVFSEDARKAIDCAIDEKVKHGGNGVLTTIDLALAVWSQRESTGHKVMAALGFNDEKAKELQSLISAPGFKED